MAVVPNPGDRLRSDRTVYTIEEVLYKGDASIACRARDEGGTTVFLKFYKTPSKFKPWFRPYLEYEKELNKRLQTDPELCQKSVYATDLFVGKMECNGSPVGGESVVQVFPFVESGITLGNILENSIASTTMVWEQRLDIAMQLAEIVSLLHANEIVHSDLKPRNFLSVPSVGKRYGLSFSVCDMDFSILSDRKAPWHDDPNQGYVGSPGYFSPEHLTGATPLPVSDVFTMSEVLCELLCGKHPFASVFAEKEEYENRIKSGVTDFAGAAMPFADGKPHPKLENALQRALSPDSAKRPSAADLLVVLRDESNPSVDTGRPTGMESVVDAINRLEATVRRLAEVLEKSNVKGDTKHGRRSKSR